tara:strand:- start:574 stop:1308 length:735 start_codon:yes stop_codon:yes gene_type:complete
MKKNDRYNYVRVPRSDDEGNRTYDVQGARLPSVTTILSRTKDQGFLRRWKAKVGEEQAEVIKNLSSKRGTAMHKFIEAFILQKGYEDLTSLGQQAKSMAEKLIETGLTPIDEYYGSEVTLYYPGLYAGTTDLICRHNEMDTVVDFKQSNSPKRKEWIDDYYLQIAAYAMAHDYVHGSKIRQGIIMICTPDLYLQEFRFQDAELRQWKHKFLARLNEYYEITREPTINEKELLAQFEENSIKEDK